MRAQVTGAAEIVHHDGLIDAGLPLSMALVLFGLSWQTMVVAMMLPTSLPMIRMFRMTSGSQPAPGRVLAVFLSGYALVWALFGFAALEATWCCIASRTPPHGCRRDPG